MPTGCPSHEAPTALSGMVLSLPGAVPAGRRRAARARTTAKTVAPVLISLDPNASEPLYSQIYRGFREAIRAGRLARGSRIPSTRVLAADFGVSRSTILLAIAQLSSEGYLESHSRSGTQVASALPDELLMVPRSAERGWVHRPSSVTATAGPGSASAPVVGQRGSEASAFIAGTPRLGPAPRPFRPGTPALDQFPTDVWARLASRRYRRLSFALLDHADPAGYGPLREAIATYVRTSRGVQCEARHVIITTGAQQALSVVTQVLLDPGDTAWVEDPGYLAMRGALAVAGVRVIGVPVDTEGIDVRAGQLLAPTARLVYTTPSHQFPLGLTMSYARRLELLAWADDANAWIIEDDYDSEYRYAGRPLPALQGLDSHGRVIYVGTFSNTLFPSLRVGYVIVPDALIDPVTKARHLADGHASAVEQAILSDFILEGHFARHIRRMRSLYGERQGRLVAMGNSMLGERLTLAPSDAGLHLIGWLPAGISDVGVSAAAAARGIEVPALSSYYRAAELRRAGLILGYAALDHVSLVDGLRALNDILPAASPARVAG